jgi:hypothetical protein
MTWRKRLRLVFSPPAEPTRRDTGLRFTDILFGFVIRELFIRLQDWGELAWLVRWQLIAATALVLGSWIGFRRSLNRSDYELKFFNLPLLRFGLDQLMLILYFRIAVLTSTDPSTPVDPQSLAQATMETLLLIFVLYALWDLFGIWMAAVPGREDSAKWKYPQIDREGEMTAEPSRKDWWALAITATFLATFFVMFLVSDQLDLGETAAVVLFILATLFLLGYRLAKEIKTSWRSPAAAPAAT